MSASEREATGAKGPREAPAARADAPKDLQTCPLCKRPVEPGEEPAKALNRHFGTDCTWRHTSPSPTRPRP